MKTASGTETAVRNNQAAIQALSPPLQAINQAFPLIQQQNDATATTLRAVYQEAHNSRQEARQFQKNLLTELTKLMKLTDRVDSSTSSLERAIIIELDHRSAQMTQLEHDLHSTHSENTGELLARLEAIVGVIGLIEVTMLTKARTRASKVFRLV